MIRTKNSRRSGAAATIRDVASASRVSTATVSRVFNDSPLVSEETRARVRAAANRLGYWPNGIARSLITNRTHSVGVLMPDLHGEFFSEIIHGVDLKTRALGLHVLVSRSSSNSQDLVATLRSMRGRVDALIVMAPDLGDATALRECSGHVPLVLLNPDTRFRTCSTLAIENVAGAREMTRHLIGLGHRRIAFVTGPERNVDARQRLEGYRQALRAAGIAPDPGLEYAGDFSERSGYEAALAILRASPRPGAIFAANDYMAVGVRVALQDHEVRVPEDLALVGFDDIRLARYLNPPLTTVHVDMLRLGERAVEMLLGPLEDGEAAVEHDVLATTLVVRRSCGANANGNGAERWSKVRPPREPRDSA